MADLHTDGCICIDNLESLYPLRDADAHPCCHVRHIGCDLTDSRYGDVDLYECGHCGRHWLNYSVEYEGYTQSGRWFSGLISREKAATMQPEEAVGYLESIEWYYRGGSYFSGKVTRVSGKVPVW